MTNNDKYRITIENLLYVVHAYTDPIRIEVVMGDAWTKYDEAKRMHDFCLVERYKRDGTSESQAIQDRLLKYYKDVPVWNLTVWVDNSISNRGRATYYGIEARCYYEDIRNGWLAEKADIKRAKRKQRRADNERNLQKN